MSAIQRSVDPAAAVRLGPGPSAQGRSEIAFLRFCAGARALLALLGSIALFGHWNGQSPLLGAVVLSYLLFSALLLDKLLAGWPAAASRGWLWLDAAFLACAAGLLDQHVPWLGLAAVAPVVAMSLLAGPLHACALAAATATALLLAGDWPWPGGGRELLPALPLMLLVFAPAANLLSQPGRSLRTRLQLLDELHRRSDPRQGLLHHVDVLLALLHDQFKLTSCVISLEGLDPRVFRRAGGGATRLLDGAEAASWRGRRRALPSDAGCIGSGLAAHIVGLDGRRRSDAAGLAVARPVLGEIGPESLTLPLMSYGRPLGHLYLSRDTLPFDAADLHCLHELMREALPLLERSDLLEQLQRETAARERERIGRDLHDSAVQPYLGLKYGLEALARHAGPDNPVAPDIAQLLALTTQELAVLRDVVSGLRNRCDPLGGNGFAAALRRQADRFEALYGLNVVITVDELQLRGTAAKAVLHMVNEALTNVRRHTPATAVAVALEAGPAAVVLRVRNDLGPAGAARPPVPPFLPRSLSERAEELGGRLQVQRASDHTEITITLPLLATMG